MSGAPNPLNLLTRAVEVLSASLTEASHFLPTRPTPCTEWDLGTLVFHVADSAATLTELLLGDPPGPPPTGGCAAAHGELRRLLAAAAHAPQRDPAVELVALTGSFELTIHAWDINQAVASTDHLPDDLVKALLSVAPLVLNEIDRGGLFATTTVPRPGRRTDTDRLLALFGRREKAL
jgi:hypothetical protein